MWVVYECNRINHAYYSLTTEGPCSHRSQGSTLFTLASITRLVVLNGMTTLRIKCCVSKISLHKDSTKCHFFVSTVAYYIIACNVVTPFHSNALKPSVACLACSRQCNTPNVLHDNALFYPYTSGRFWMTTFSSATHTLPNI